VVTGEIWVLGGASGSEDVDDVLLPAVHAVSKASAQQSAPDRLCPIDGIIGLEPAASPATLTIWGRA
jgi:hypothetical protein